MASLVALETRNSGFGVRGSSEFHILIRSLHLLNGVSPVFRICYVMPLVCKLRLLYYFNHIFVGIFDLLCKYRAILHHYDWSSREPLYISTKPIEWETGRFELIYCCIPVTEFSATVFSPLDRRLQTRLPIFQQYSVTVTCYDLLLVHLVVNYYIWQACSYLGHCDM